METHTYIVRGMSCGGCVKHVEKALRSVAGVEQVVVEIAKGTVTVQGTAPFADLAASVEAAGYQMALQD